MSNGKAVAVAAPIACFFLASCATTSSQVAFHEEVIAPNQDDAIVYVYRPASFVGGAVSLPVKLDGKVVAVLKQKAYVVFHAAPGEHEVAVGNVTSLAFAINQAATEKHRTFTATPRGVYFLKSKAAITFLVSREEAMKEIVDMKYDMGL